MNEQQQREQTIVRTSFVGIGANVLLTIFKAIIGTVTGSIAITLDAVNNLSDAASSIITIVGTKLAGKEADKKHPFGYGRIEYLTAMIISVIVLYAGITSLTESVKKIIHPETPSYTTAALVIVAVGVIVKIVLGRYVKNVGVKVDSDALVASGEDATNDSIISAATLAAALIFNFTGFSLEAWLGAIIAIVIIKSGVDMLRDTLSRILGESAEASLINEIKKTVQTDFPDVQGVYDVVINDYGPNMYTGSFHIEVPDTYSADGLDRLLRKIQIDVMEKHHIITTAIGVYSINTKDPEAIAIREEVRELVTANPYILRMHGFFLDQEEKSMRFDMVVSYEAPDRMAVYREVLAELEKKYEGYSFNVAMDRDLSGLDS